MTDAMNFMVANINNRQSMEEFQDIICCVLRNSRSLGLKGRGGGGRRRRRGRGVGRRGRGRGCGRCNRQAFTTQSSCARSCRVCKSCAVIITTAVVKIL